MGNDKTAARDKIMTINAVEGFDPTPLAVEYTDLNTGETHTRLPVMAQVAWFRLKYPEGRFTISVTAGKDCFIATAKVYKDYKDPLDCYLSEATASRGYLADKPTVSPREWAQTAALGIALRNAGFGLQFHAAGDSFDEPAVNELGHIIEPQAAAPDAANETILPAAQEPEKTGENEPSPVVASETVKPKEDPLESAMKMPCPIKKYSGRNLGSVLAEDPGAIAWIANKFTGAVEIIAAAKLICEHSLAVVA
jgi:hypothetical protein